jgi:hypothetical protein
MPNYPAAHPAGAHTLGAIPGHYAPHVPVMMMPWSWPTAAAPGWGMPGPFSFQLPVSPGWQPAQPAWAQQAQAVEGSAIVAAAGGSKAGQRRNQVSKRGRQQLLVEAADREDEYEEAGCSSDDD